MKYVEGAQRRRDPSTRQHSSTFYIVDVTQASSVAPTPQKHHRSCSRARFSSPDSLFPPAYACGTWLLWLSVVGQADYYEGWGLHGRFILIESVIMDCLAEEIRKQAENLWFYLPVAKRGIYSKLR